MIVGHGDIANILKDREGALFFASGVSNSACEDQEKFKRERLLLMEQRQDLCCFYFSSIFTDIKNTPYFDHKWDMERIIERHFINYNIIRIGNISWGTNPHTFLNYIRDRKKKGWPVKIKNEYRYMIEVDQLRLLTDNLPLIGQNVINIFGRMAKVKDLI